MAPFKAWVAGSKGVRNIHVIGHGLLDNVYEFVGTVIDITERKRAEEELQHLVDLVPQMIVVVGPDTKWIYANRGAREYTELTLQEWSGMSGLDVIGRLVHPDDAERIGTVRKRALAKSEPFEVDVRLLGKDGIYRWFLVRYNPLVEESRVRKW